MTPCRRRSRPPTRRLSLTGTPFRSDDNPIPFVRYEPGPDGLARSAADASYGYADALADGVVRPVLFLAYSGQTRWRTRAGDEISATLGEPLTSDATARAWRTALDPNGEWIPAVLAAADTRLTQVRAGGQPDAGGLVIATDRAAARAYAKHLHEITGVAPVVVLSDEAGASQRIARFGESDERWMVAVRMVSEGVDVPRLAVGVYATNASTPLYFAQAIGRFVRSRRPGEAASVFLPSVPALLALAADMEATRDHVLGAPKRDGRGVLGRRRAHGGERRTHRARGRRFRGTARLGRTRPAHLRRGIDRCGDEPAGRGLRRAARAAQPGAGRACCSAGRGRPGRLARPASAGTPGSRPNPRPARRRTTLRAGSSPRERELGAHERRTALRRELALLVAARHHRTGAPHALIHGELRSACGGPQLALATADEVQQRIDMLRAWAAAGARSR